MSGAANLAMAEDHEGEQEMEIEALEAILMDDIQEVEASVCNFDTSARCFQITISPMGDDEDEPTEIPVRLALYFAHTARYPEELPLLAVRSLQGLKSDDCRCRAAGEEKLDAEASENLGMAMMYTLATSAKEWLREKCGNVVEVEEEEEEGEKEEEVIQPHGLPVTLETFLEWRDRYEAELALERAKLHPDASFLGNKEKRMTGRQWFDSGRHSQKGGGNPGVVEEEEDEEEEEDIDFDDDDDDTDDIDEEEMLDHYLAGKTGS